MVGEIIDALGIGSSTYYEQRDDGRLVCADNLLRVAANLGLNPVELMLSCGLLSENAITECSEKISAGTASAPSKRRLKRRVDLPPL